MKIKHGIAFIFILIFFSCKTKNFAYKNQKIITQSCELKNKINDTIIISGKYLYCEEYTGFMTIEKDSCYNDFNMFVNFNNVIFSKKFSEKLDKMSVCGFTMKMIVKATIKKEKFIEYGHLGSNNAEIIILEIIDFQEPKYHKP